MAADPKLELKRKALFVPCKTKEALHRWIKTYLGLDIPDGIVDPDSTSSPMDVIWEVYDAAMTNRPGFKEVLAFASRDSFKCVEKGTRLLVNGRGVLRIEDVRIGDVVWSGKAWRRVTDWIHDGEKKSCVLVLENGQRLTTSPIHRVWAWEPGGVPGWKKVSELTSLDLVRVDTNSGYAATDWNEDDFDVGYLCGILQGDGCQRFIVSEGFVTLSNVDEHVLSFWKKACLKYAGRLPKQSASRPCDWTVHSRAMIDILVSWGIEPHYSHEKRIPERCWQSASALAGFISGLYDTDGTPTSKKSIEFPITAEGMCQDLMVALSALGVNARFRKNRLYKEHGQNRPVCNVIVNHNDVPALVRAGVKLSAKKAQPVPLDEPGDDAHDAIPATHLRALLDRLPSTGGKNKRVGRKPTTSYKTITRAKIQRLLSWAEDNAFLSPEELSFWREVVSTKWYAPKKVEIGTADFYDLTVEEDHSYWSNGIVSHNTLGASVIETLMILHCDRSVAHMAAIESQAKKSQEYNKKFFRRPILRDYVVLQNEKKVEVARYVHEDTKEIITPKQFETLQKENPSAAEKYTEVKNYITIVICTKQGANSEHVPFMVIDEIDVIEGAAVDAYHEAKMIPAPYGGKLPITLYTSTRKYNYGLVQKDLVEKADKKKLHVRHWNIIDVTEKCAPERHLPAEPKITIYRNQETFEAVNEDEWKLLDPDQQSKFEKDLGYAGCLRNCRLFAACQGRLATADKPYAGPTNLLKPIEHVIGQFASVPPDKAQAQLMCYKPASTGLIYPRFDRRVHLIPAAQIAERITGRSFPPNLSKAELIGLMRERGLGAFAGQDYGYSHNFATVVMFVDGIIGYIVHVISAAELELAQKIDYCQPLKEMAPPRGPAIYPDTAYPADIKTFRKAGFVMKEWKKDAGSVKGGIEVVRMKLRPSMKGEPQLYFLKGDPLVELLCERMEQYHWKLDAAGNPTDQPDDKLDDECDAMRYCVYNVFGPKGTFVVSSTEPDRSELPTVQEQQYTVQGWMQQVISEHMGATASLPVEGGAPQSAGRKGSFLWNL